MFINNYHLKKKNYLFIDSSDIKWFKHKQRFVK